MELVMKVATILAHRGVEMYLSEQLLLGNKTKSVFRARRAVDNYPLVVKIGDTEKGAKEVLDNVAGYEEIVNLGIEWLIPEYRELITVEETPVIIMSDCGEVFLEASKTHPEPVQLYEQLAQRTDRLYWNTFRGTNKPYEFAETCKRLLQKSYVELQSDRCSPDVAKCINAWKVSSLRTDFCSFSTFDFTPEDVFVNEKGLKYADPKAGQLGVPIIDMACFAGTALAHQLPESEAGHDLLRSCATSELASMFDYSRDQAEMCYEIGRAIQLGFSSHFRREKTPAKAAEMFAEGQEKILTYCS